MVCGLNSRMKLENFPWLHMSEQDIRLLQLELCHLDIQQQAFLTINQMVNALLTKHFDEAIVVWCGSFEWEKGYRPKKLKCKLHSGYLEVVVQVLPSRCFHQIKT